MQTGQRSDGLRPSSARVPTRMAAELQPRSHGPGPFGPTPSAPRGQLPHPGALPPMSRLRASAAGPPRSWGRYSVRPWESASPPPRTEPQTPPDDQRHKALKKGHNGRYSNSLLGGVPLSSTRFSTQEIQFAVQSVLGVGVTCLTPFTDHTTISSASTADKRVDVYGHNIKKLPGAPGGGLQQIATPRWARYRSGPR